MFIGRQGRQEADVHGIRCLHSREKLLDEDMNAVEESGRQATRVHTSTSSAKMLLERPGHGTLPAEGSWRAFLYG